MTCYFCKGNLIESHTVHVSEVGECVIIIKNVPCLKCDQCVEISYTGSIYKQIENIVDASRNALTEVTIVKYSDKVA